jgi:hypothetical protein
MQSWRDGPNSQHCLRSLPPQGRFVTVQPLEHAVVDVGESQKAKCKSSGGAGEIIEGFRNPILFVVGLNAPMGCAVERRPGKMMHGTIRC